MQVQPIGDVYANHKELTLRGIILGALFLGH